MWVLFDDKLAGANFLLCDGFQRAICTGSEMPWEVARSVPFSQACRVLRARFEV